MTSVSVVLDPELLDRVFAEEADGKLRFGYSATSVGPATLAQLYERHVEFQDYVMEGFVKYRLGLRRDEHQTMLDVELLGTNRDQYLERHIRWHLGMK